MKKVIETNYQKYIGQIRRNKHHQCHSYSFPPPHHLDNSHDQTCLPDWDVESDKERPRTSIPAGEKVFLQVEKKYSC